VAEHTAEIAIVGGGPAGSTLALALVREQKIDPSDIVIVEKTAHPREKPCAGAISNFGVAALAEMNVPLEVPHAPMGGVRVLRDEEIGALQTPLGIVVRRNEFDASLFRRAEKDGVRTLEGEPLLGLERTKAGFVLQTRSRVVRAKRLAACDGAGSTTRKLLGLKEPARKGHLYVTETPQTDRDEGTRVDLCDFDLAPTKDGLQGYYWDFPIVMDGKRCVSRGIYHANLTPAKNVKASLERHLAKRGVAIDEVELKPFSTRPFVKTSTVCGDGWVLVGEAAGIDATTGEGIAQAIVFGRVAAKHLAASLASGLRNFEAYRREIFDSVMGRHLLQSAWLAKYVYGKRGLPFQDYLLRSEFAREIAARWYEGQSLGLFTVAKLAVGLARHAV
jgi:flavin-dependent dehydrogenase